MHWAITGQTAAELIVSREDSKKPHMGLTSWRGTKVRKEDVAIAKSYLDEEELAALNNLVEQYLLFATGQAMRRIPMRMADWIKKLDSFMTINDCDILTHAGRISHELATDHAGREYDAFHQQRLKLEAAEPDDFDRAIKSLPPPPSKKTSRKRSKGGSLE